MLARILWYLDSISSHQLKNVKVRPPLVANISGSAHDLHPYYVSASSEDSPEPSMLENAISYKISCWLKIFYIRTNFTHTGYFK